MQIVVFEDDSVSRLFPITIGRPTYAISCGSFRLIDWLDRLGRELNASLQGVVRPYLKSLQQFDYPQFDRRVTNTELPLLVVNARLVPSMSAYRTLARLTKENQSTAFQENG